MKEDIPHLRLVSPADRPKPGPRPRFTRGDLTDTFQKQNPAIYMILDKIAARAATWCADKVREDFKDSASLVYTETPIAATMGLDPFEIRISFTPKVPLPSLTRFPDVRLVAKGCGFQDPDIPVVLYAPSNDRQTQSQTIIYIDQAILNRKTMAACMARVAAYNDMGPKDFILLSMIEMMQNKGPHMGTPLQKEMDKLGTTTLKAMGFVSPPHR